VIEFWLSPDSDCLLSSSLGPPGPTISERTDERGCKHEAEGSIAVLRELATLLIETRRGGRGEASSGTDRKQCLLVGLFESRLNTNCAELLVGDSEGEFELEHSDLGLEPAGVRVRDYGGS
jgi:hypothetical protein